MGEILPVPSSSITRHLGTLRTSVSSVSAYLRDGTMPEGYLTLSQRDALLAGQKQALMSLGEKTIEPFQDPKIVDFLLQTSGRTVHTFGGSNSYWFDKPGSGMAPGTRWMSVYYSSENRSRVKTSGKKIAEILLLAAHTPALRLRMMDYNMHYPIGKTEPGRYRDAILASHPYTDETDWSFDAGPVGKKGNLSATKELTAIDLAENPLLLAGLIDGSASLFNDADQAIRNMTLTTDQAQNIESFIEKISS